MSSIAAAYILATLAGPVGLESWRPPELAVEEREPVKDFEALKEIAFQYLGRPYRMGGVGNPAIDCSGFTCRVYAEAGYAIPRVSRDQAKMGDEVALDAVQPGDLLFFGADKGSSRITHVGIFLGDGQMIHASSGQGEVVVSELSMQYYQDRILGARRILNVVTSTRTESVISELEEHSGRSVLPIAMRLPNRLPAPSLGAQVAWSRSTSLALRALASTELGVLGLTLVPEATLHLPDWAFLASVAVPIRFEADEDPTVGRIDGVADATRFIRTVALGLEGAELEARLDRNGDVSLGGGFVVDRLAPGAGAGAVPGLTAIRTPLTLSAAYRGRPIRGELFAADVADFGLFGFGVGLPLFAERLVLSAAFASDQRAGRRPLARAKDPAPASAGRAINAIELASKLSLLDRSRWSIDAFVDLASARTGGRLGFGGAAGASGQYRFGRSGASYVDLSLWSSVLSAGILESLFGPTYAGAALEHLAALERSVFRPTLGAEVLVRLAKMAFGIGFSDAIGGDLLDRRSFVLAELEALTLGGRRWLDLRVVYAARGLFGARLDGMHDVLHAGARLRFASWLAAELFVEKAERVEGGIGVAVGYEP